MDDLSPAVATRLEQEKLAALYQFAYGLSHEINNPLTNISARAQALLATEKDVERRRTLATIHSQALRAYEMIADLMLFARPPTPRLQPVDLGQLVERVVLEWMPTAQSQATTLEWAPPDSSISCTADPEQLAVAIGAILRNALEALGRGGRITLRITNAANGEATLSIADTGPGISAEARRHLFDPYFSGREAGRGLGLGLSKCWRILELHGGRIDVESPATGGAAFHLAIPRTASDQKPLKLVG